MAFVLVQHAAAGQEPFLKEVLEKQSPIEVVLAKDGMSLEANKLHVAPAAQELLLERGVFHVTPAARAVPRLAIDQFFRSLARDQRSAAIGVILSGAGSGGTLGLQAIKHEAGITFVQDPTTAGHPSMPQS